MSAGVVSLYHHPEETETENPILYIYSPPCTQVKEHTASSAEDRRRFLDEMLVWREMAVHFVYYHPDNYDGACARR